MPYPNTTASLIVIAQTSGSAVGGQFPFIERQISGSNLFLVTDASGNLTGSTSIPGGSFTNLTVTGALTASVISASTAITSAAITSGPITASTISASGAVTASTLNIVGNTVASTITGSLSGSSIATGNATINGGAINSTTIGLTTPSTGNFTSLTSSNFTSSGTTTLNTVNITGLLSASGNISGSNIFDAGTLTVIGNSVLTTISASNISASGAVLATSITGSFSGSNISTGNATINGGAINGTTIGITTPSTGNFTNLTASNISSSNISASNLFITNGLVYRESMTTGSINADIYFSASAITSSNIVVQVDASVTTGSVFALVLNATSSTGGIAYALSASSGIILGTVFSGSTFSGSGFSGSVTGQTLTMTGNSVLTTISASNISASGFISASNIFDANTLTVIGNSVLATISASNISASGNISGSNGWFNNLNVAGAITGSISGSITTANSASIAANNSTATVQYITFVDGTGNRPLYVDQDSLTWQPSTNTLSSSGNMIAVNYTASRITSTGGAGSSTAVGTQGILASGGIGVSGNSYFASDVGIGTTLTVGGNISGSSAFWLNGNATLAGNSATVTHTGTGNLTISSTAGNVLIEGSTFNANDVTVPGDVAINGGDLTTTATSFNLLAGATTTIAIGAATTTASHAGIVDITNTTPATIVGGGSLATDGGVYIGKNLIVSGSTTLYGDVTMFGTGSVINISSSNVIIGDNRIQLNAWSVGGPQRYSGVDVFDSGSSTAVTSSLLWDSLNNYWLLQSNQSGSNPIVTSSAIILQGPTSSFGSEFLLTANNFLKVQTITGNMITSSLSEVGNTLQYAGTISASIVSGSFYGTTGSYINLNVFTGSSPGVGNVPTSPTDIGVSGQIEVDNNFIYVYTNNLWKRAALNVWSS